MHEDWNGEERRQQRDRWHVGREIPIAVVIAVALQTISGIWWAAGLSSKMDSTQAQIIELKMDRYSSSDARRDHDLTRLRDENMERRISILENITRNNQP